MDNFISTRILKYMKIGSLKLPKPRTIWNIDGTHNKAGAITDFVDLQVQCGPKVKEMQFLVMDLGEDEIILGYPWLAVFQPDIDWKAAVLAEELQPLVIKTLGLPPSEGYDSILTITDHDCTKMIIAIPCQETINAEGVANLYLQQVFPCFGLPSKVISNRDPWFVSQLMKEICHLLGITQNISMAYHPRTDGQSERTNQWIEQYLRFWVNHQQDNWNHYLPLTEFAHNSWPNETMKQTPFEALMGYTPRAETFDVTTSIPMVALQMEIWKKARRIADKMIVKAQKRWVQSKNPLRTYQKGDLVWLEGRNLHLDRPAIKLAPKRHGPFKVTRVLSPITYQLELPPQWKIHEVFHIDLLTPYRETNIHGPNFAQPPPDLVNGEEEYEVEEILDSRKHGRRRKVQYLVKWKGYPSSDNQWVNWDDMHAEEALAKFRKQRPNAISHIRRGEDEGQEPSPPMQSNASTVSPTLLDSPAGSTISDPFIPNTFSVEGQGIETTVAEAFLSWCPQVPSSW